MWEDGGHILIFFLNSSMLLPPYPYLLLRHKIGLDIISGKGVNFKASSPHIFSRMSHICCIFTDMVPRSYCYLTKVVNLSTPSMQIWPKNQYRPHHYGSVCACMFHILSEVIYSRPDTQTHRDTQRHTDKHRHTHPHPHPITARVEQSHGVLVYNKPWL